MVVREILESLNLNPQDYCLTINGVKKVDATTLGDIARNTRFSRGGGCYKYGTSPGVAMPFNPNIQKPTHKRR